MSQIIQDLRSIYRIRHYDFMGYTIRTINDLSYHHINKLCDGGKKTLSNGALLARDTAHPYLHIIESRDLETYLYINKILKIINTQQAPPTIAQLREIRDILLQFEEKHKRDTNAKGKLLIKEQFIRERIEL